MSSSTNKQDENSKKPKEQPKTETSLLHKKLSNYQVTDLKGVSYINILLIGEKGAGKSSLLSTFHRSIFNNYTEPPIAQVGTRQTKAFTRKKKGYKLNPTGTIVGHDTKGLETLLKPEIEQVKAIRDGRVLDNVEVIQKQKWGFWDYLYSLLSRNPAAILDPSCLMDPNTPTTIQDLPHAVIFVVPANQRRVPEELEDFVNLFTEYGYNPLFAVTKIDCHGGQKGDLYAATHLYDSKKEELIELFDLEYERVKPIQNYTQWDKREVSIENLALDLLNRAVQTAEKFITSLEEKSKIRSHGILQDLSDTCTTM